MRDAVVEYFQLRWYGELAVITPTSEVENLPSNVIEEAARMILTPLKDRVPSGLIVDLSAVNHFSSEFISFLLRCHLIVKPMGYEMVLAGVSPRIRELLNQTNLDTIWAIYPNRAEAMAVMRSE